MKLTLVRHGESLWNRENKFTGWSDIDLTAKGKAEARECGRILYNNDISFSKIYTSYLRRAIKSAYIISETSFKIWLPIVKAWQLNERHYGALQGVNKDDATKEHGAEKVKLWRRSYYENPPLITENDHRFPLHDVRYNGIPTPQLPIGESLKDTSERVLPYYEKHIVEDLRNGEDILIVAHGNSLRALIMMLESLDADEIEGREIATGVPIVYDLDHNFGINSITTLTK